MIKIFPSIDLKNNRRCPVCSTELVDKGELIWQGVHICTENYCTQCEQEYISNLPLGQAKLLPFDMRKSDGKIFGSHKHDWIVDPLKKIITPVLEPVKFEILSRDSHLNSVIILNTLDNCYGHSLLFLLNLQEIIKHKGEKKVIVIIQPFLKWLLPKEGVAEVWVVSLSFNQLRNYYSDLTHRINKELLRFKEVYIYSAALCPKEVSICQFSKIKSYNFDNKPLRPRVTFIWRQDNNRLWFKSYWFYGALRKFKIASIFLPFHYARVLFFLCLMKFKLKDEEYQISLAGLGQFGWFPKFVEDCRVDNFNKETEVEMCKVYSESELVIGVHGSSMILPSAHAGMTISMMPIKRWGNFIEDILYTEKDVRLAAFQKRVIPLNLSIFETIDICCDMLSGREYFVEKFKQTEEL